MCVKLTMNVSIISLRRLSDPVKILSASVSMEVVRQEPCVERHRLSVVIGIGKTGFVTPLLL